MINSYDFDKTIYSGDSTIDFYIFCLRKKKTLIKHLPNQLWGMLLYILKIKEKEYYKEKFFSFLKSLDDVDKYVEEFWKKNHIKIKTWYLDVKKESDVIISASPFFLLKPIIKKLEVNLIATKVNKYTGKFESKNCKGEEKVKRFKKEFKNTKINKFYSDSMSDLPMMRLANKAYLVNKDNIKEINLN